MDFRLSALLALLSIVPVAAGAQPGGDPRTFTVDADASDVHWRVYKAGAFARFGHNHVISVEGLAGTVSLGADGAADWTLSFNVADLVVDDPALRDQYGEEFSSQPTEDDIDGTQRNMLSETVLMGDQFRTITVRGDSYEGPLASAQLDIVVEMLGRSIALTVPGTVSVSGATLIAEGEFSLEHEDLGMTPFSVMMGALQVAPRIDFTYRINAIATD